MPHAKKEALKASFLRRAFTPHAWSVARAFSTNFANATLSMTAMSARTLRSTAISAFFKPFMNTLYVMPCSRAAALIRVIHNARKSRFLLRRSRYAYWPARMTASLATRNTFLRRPRKPFACCRTFLCAARATTPRFTLGMSRLLSVRKHRVQRALVRWMGGRGAAQMAFTLLRLLREDVAQIRAAALELAAGEFLETLRRAALRLQLRHDCSCFSLAPGAPAGDLKPGHYLLGCYYCYSGCFAASVVGDT